MHKRIGISICLLTLLTFTSCLPESKHPVSDLSEAEFEPNLCGVWIREDEDDVSYLHIGAEADKALAAGAEKPEPGLMRFQLASHAKQEGRPVLHGSIGGRFFITKLVNNRYANIVSPLELSYPTEPAGDRSYLLMRFQVNDVRLAIYFLNMQEAAKAIDRGDLAGTVTREGQQIKNVQLTSDSKRLAEFLPTEAGEKLFRGDPLVYRRLR